MHAIIVQEMRLIEPVSSAPRRGWRRRRIRSHLRRFGRGVAARAIGSWSGLIRALHESRHRSAARLIDQHRHLVDDEHGARHASLKTRPSGPVQP
jgi:hypothetical protein